MYKIQNICVFWLFLILAENGQEEGGEEERGREGEKEINAISCNRKLIIIVPKITKVRNTIIIWKVKSTYLLIFPKWKIWLSIYVI